jgi:RNase P protein component
LAARRNRIRRQVIEALRVILRTAQPRSGVAVTVHQAEIPQGTELQKVLIELLRESGMIDRA